VLFTSAYRSKTYEKYVCSANDLKPFFFLFLFTRLFFGFISNDDGTNSNIDWTDLNIHQFGENGRVTEELCFLIRIGTAVIYLHIIKLTTITNN